MNLKDEPAHIGRHCGSSRHPIDPETVRFYADALDDRSPLYPEIAPSLLFHSECYRFLGEWYLRNLFGNLHARQDWWLFAPLRLGATVVSRSTLVDRYHKRGRDYVVNETDLVEAETGRLLVRGHTHQSFLPPDRGPEDAGGIRPGEAARSPRRPPFPTATGPELQPVEKTVDARRCWMFSGPGRNYHTDRDEARKLGFPNIVVQGMMTTCFVSQVMQDAFGLGWVEGGRMSVKLTNVLWVDETVIAHARVREETAEGVHTRVVCDVWVEKDDATRVLIGEASAVR